MRSPDQNRQFASRADLTDCLVCLSPEIADRPWLFLQAYLIEDVMWYVLLLMLGNLVCYDRQTLVHLHGIAVDDFAIKAQSQLDGELPTMISLERFYWEIENTLDLPVPVAPMTAMRGSAGILRGKVRCTGRDKSIELTRRPACSRSSMRNHKHDNI